MRLKAEGDQTRTCGRTGSFLAPKEAGGSQHLDTAEIRLAHASVHHEVLERRWGGVLHNSRMQGSPRGEGLACRELWEWALPSCAGAWPGTALPLAGKQDPW